MAKLWEKNYSMDKLMEEFTVGRDFRLDMNLIPSDCAASLAHGKMLESIGILSSEEFSKIENELRNIIIDHERGDFVVAPEDEDGHTAIENRLSQVCGEAGKRIHTGRSRNDQVVTAVRIWGRSLLLAVLKSGGSLYSTLIEFANKNKNVPMAGRTHMQTAMPSTVGLWAAAFAEELADDLSMVLSTLELIDQSPLGAAAGYGVPLPLDRELSARLMGFERLQNNVIYVNNSRGKFESLILDSLDQLTMTLGKLSTDLIIYSMVEFSYFTLPDQLCSGSSIMPQKKNPDGLELTRGAAAVVASAAAEVKNIIRSLPSGYNRDFQAAKEPFIRGCRTALQALKVMDLTVAKLKVNEDNLLAGFTPSIYATDAALELVASGMSFRDAYKDVGLNLDKLEKRDPYGAIKTRTHSGSPGNPCLASSLPLMDKIESRRDQIERRVAKALGDLAGFDLTIITPIDYR